MKIGAIFIKDNSCGFTVWAPFASSMEVEITGKGVFGLKKDERGYWSLSVNGLVPGDRYQYILDGKKKRPDPASFSQPVSVHGPSEIIKHNSFCWSDDDWKGLDIRDMIIYELHTGVFSEEGTFNGIIPHLDELSELGVNTIELMPVAQFPGDRNWGYDGVFPFAVQQSYGGVAGLKTFVNECHKRKIAVLLDVVYNHLGPEGNYLWDYGPYFSKNYKSQWSDALNFDGEYSDEVRNYFIENAIYWLEVFHIDGLRLDAVHAIIDMSARPFISELSERILEYFSSGRKRYLVAESDLNNPVLVRPGEKGGYNLDAQWCDDYHHALHTLLTGDKDGYYSDFGEIGQFARAYVEGYVYSGQYSSHRKRSHGSPSLDIPPEKFVVFAQNHDQVGNRMTGDRLSALISFEGLKLSAGAVILSPFIPLLFMGEEFGEKNPFLFFISHSDDNLIEAVRRGRREEFSSFAWKGVPPDPQDENTFLSSKLNHKIKETGKNKILLDFYRELIKIRKTVALFSRPEKDGIKALCGEAGRTVLILRKNRAEKAMVLYNFRNAEEKLVITGEHLQRTGWKKIIDSAAQEWSGLGAKLPDKIDRPGDYIMPPQSFTVYMEISG